MAMSGTLNPSTENNSYNKEVLIISWSAEYDVENLKATFTFNAYIRIPNNAPYPNRAYAVYGGTNLNYIKISGVIDPDHPGQTKTETAFSTESGGSGTKTDPYNGYANYMKENGTNKHNDGIDQFGNWEGHPNAWVYIHTRPIIGKSYEVPIDDDGVATCKVSALLTDYTNGVYKMQISETTVSTAGTPAEICSKIGHKESGSWTNNGRIWHKENGVWKKRNLYRKSGNNWTRV